MLVLSRKVGEEIVVGGNVTIKVSRIAGNRVTIGIEAPAEVRVLRGELQPVAASFEAEPSVSSDATVAPAGAVFELPLEEGPFVPPNAR